MSDAIVRNVAGLTYVYTATAEHEQLNGIQAGTICYDITSPPGFAVLPMELRDKQKTCPHVETRPFGTYFDPDAVMCIGCQKWFNPPGARHFDALSEGWPHAVV